MANTRYSINIITTEIFGKEILMTRFAILPKQWKSSFAVRCFLVSPANLLICYVTFFIAFKRIEKSLVLVKFFNVSRPFFCLLKHSYVQYVRICSNKYIFR